MFDNSIDTLSTTASTSRNALWVLGDLANPPTLEVLGVRNAVIIIIVVDVVRDAVAVIIPILRVRDSVII